MTGLILKLAPNERVLVNGAVIENGEKRAKISIRTPNANILRLKDAIHPDEINTPVKRVCYTAQLILSGDLSPEEGWPALIKGIEQLTQVFEDPSSRRILANATDFALSDNAYGALRSLRDLLPREARLFAVSVQ